MKKILIIEDEPQMRENLSTILEMEGFDVLAAGDGREGVALAKDGKPDLILCDVMMPRLDGYGVLEASANELTCELKAAKALIKGQPSVPIAKFRVNHGSPFPERI